jgi:O-succinylbenzoic acid--CoA ligase
MQAAAQIHPCLWLGAEDNRWPAASAEIKYDASLWAGTILIPTGGTGGRVRWAVHTWCTLAAAARSLDTFLGDGPFTHVCTLPPWHVSGLMPTVRAIETGGKLQLDDWKILEAGTPPGISSADAVISIVPTQLRRLLSQPAVVDWLRGTRAILLGGAKADDDLLDAAHTQRLPICLAYGMTETAAVVAAQTPADFLAGEPPRVTPLPHANLWIGDDTGAPLLVGEPGRVWIEAESLFAGYFPNHRAPGPWATEDSGVLDAQGRLKILGRLDRVIVTGGEKVNPAEIERRIREGGLVKDVLVVGVPDAEWGERVTAIYTGAPRAEAELRAAIESLVAPYARPKSWIKVEYLPGKNKKIIHHDEREEHERI